MQDYEYLLSTLDKIKGIGNKTVKLFYKKKIKTIFDLLWHLPISKIETSRTTNIKSLQIGKDQSIKIVPLKYNFPRIRKLPNRVNCLSSGEKIDCIFFNSYEGYIKKILPINKEVIVFGRIGFYKGKYQITNPKTLSKNEDVIIEGINNYSLTEGLTITKYNKIVNEVLKNIPKLEEWHSKSLIKKFNNVGWKQSIEKIHNFEYEKLKNSDYLRRLIFDEIFANFLISSQIRLKIKKIKKKRKLFNNLIKLNYIKKLKFELTNDQKNAIKDIERDLNSKERMFRLIQGDVGSGKTIVSLISALNTINSGYQVALMVPTEILAKQHYNFSLNFFNSNINIELLYGKTDYLKKKMILKDLEENKINLIIGTHALFQKKIKFNKLGLIIIDEQHKFGVNQRKELSDKGGNDCDVLVMSATPIPRTMMMTIYGDMDVTLIKEKPKNRKEIKTYSKLDTKIVEVINFAKKEILNGGQVFWVCPLIEKSKKLDFQSAIEKNKSLQKYFNNRVGLIHGAMDKEDKNRVLNEFLNKKIDVLVSTTVIEVGIDFPKANVIIIENANKYGLSQLHQLRGRVGRGDKKSFCILIFKSHLSENAKKRINILKNSNDGFDISEQDMELRGYGDILGFKQSGIKKFKLADPILNKDLFMLAENEIKKFEVNQSNLGEYNKLLKLYDRASIINDII
ncbi:MAG: ATP-dependent DNA helicase RecG [Candidatus Pelagibacter sp.]